MVDRKREWNAINRDKSKNNEKLKEDVEKFLTQYRENKISRDELINNLRMSEYTKVLSEQQIHWLLTTVDSMTDETKLSNDIQTILEETKAFWLDYVNEYVVERWMFQALDNIQECEEKEVYNSLLNNYLDLEHQGKENINLDYFLNEARNILYNAELKWKLKSDRSLLDIWTWEKGTYWLLFLSLWYKNVTLQDVSSVNIDTLKMNQNEGGIPKDVKLKVEDIINADETTQYDTIVANFVLHHIESRDDKQKFFDKIYKLLKPEGRAIISFFMPNSHYMNGDSEFFPSFYDNHPVSNISHEIFVKLAEDVFGPHYRFLWNGVIKWKNLFYWTYELIKLK